MFGHEKGAFTGATQAHLGWFEAAQGGTLLLDEIGELSLPLQVKLLRVLQEREITRVGSRKAIKIDVRVIAATHVDLAQAIRERRFREDLFYRLNIAVVPLPPLRQRRETSRCWHSISSPCMHAALAVRRVACRLTRWKRARHSWPGNIRELENTLHNAVLLSRDETLTPTQLRLAGYSERAYSETDDSTLDSFLRQQITREPQQLFDRVIQSLISNALEIADNNQTQAATLLGISRHTLRTHLAQMGVIKGRRKSAVMAFPHVSGVARPERELRIGFQKFGNLGVLKARQTLEQCFNQQGISVVWSEFPAGPQLLYALQNNEIDFGTTGEVPPIFAQASGNAVTYIAGSHRHRAASGLWCHATVLSTTGRFAGKRISVNKGSNVHWLLLQLLEEAGIGLDEIKVVYTPPKYPLTASDYLAVDAG